MFNYFMLVGCFFGLAVVLVGIITMGVHFIGAL